MSLMHDQMERCAYLDKTTVPDGFGGVIPEWPQGAEFKAAIVYESSMQARVAEVQGVKGMYRVTVPKSIKIGYGDAFVCLSGEFKGMTFRCVSKDDSATPKAASFQVRVFNAKEWNPGDD